MRGCAARDETWINDTIFRGYFALHRLGYAHSVEVWEGDELVGGVYGVTLGRAFFGESMFSRATDASKIALATLIAHLRQTGFELFDTQFTTEHLACLGAVEVPRADYHRMLDAALENGVAEILSRPLPAGDAVIALLTGTERALTAAAGVGVSGRPWLARANACARVNLRERHNFRCRRTAIRPCFSSIITNSTTPEFPNMSK